ncbi:MAG: hypothetical protein ABTQ27_15535 [Amaricoccus sp.]|uniref:hypothetical protein n=1 Tax=Amaricoccus sp. TaxID=1872485 RepID=UPI003315BE54
MDLAEQRKGRQREPGRGKRSRRGKTIFLSFSTQLDLMDRRSSRCRRAARPCRIFPRAHAGKPMREALYKIGENPFNGRVGSPK